MKKLTAPLLVFPALAVAAMAFLGFVLTPGPKPLPLGGALRPALQQFPPSAGTTDSRDRATDRAEDGEMTPRGLARRNPTDPHRPPAGPVFSPPPPSLPTGGFKTAPAVPGSPAETPRTGSSARARGTLQPLAGQPVPEATSFVVDPGVPIPAALTAIDPAVGLSEKQADLQRQIAAEFVQAVNNSADPSAAWKTGQVRADARFRKLFGDDLYRWQSLKVTREARGLSDP